MYFKFIVTALAICASTKSVPDVTKFITFVQQVSDLQDLKPIDLPSPFAPYVSNEDRDRIMELNALVRKMERLKNALNEYSVSDSTINDVKDLLFHETQLYFHLYYEVLLVVAPMLLAQLAQDLSMLFMNIVLLAVVYLKSKWAAKFLFAMAALSLVLEGGTWLFVCKLGMDSEIITTWNPNYNAEQSCPQINFWNILDSLDLFFDLDSFCNWKVLNTAFDFVLDFDIQFSQIGIVCFWYYFCINSPLNEPSKSNACTTKKRVHKSKKTKEKKAESQENEFVPPSDWLWHCCLYGHKDTLKKILDKKLDEININEIKTAGNTALHLAVMSDHLPVVQILVSRFAKEGLDFNVRNEDNLSPLDLALIKANNAITKLLLKHVNPEMSSLVYAIKSHQISYASMFFEKLKNDMEKHPLVRVSIQRFIVISKEMELKTTSAERKEECKGNLAILEKFICGQLLMIYHSQDKTFDDKSRIKNKKIKKEEEPSSKPEKFKNSSDVSEIEEIYEEFSCPVCFHLMKQPERRIYSCSNDHWICSICMADANMSNCPICREDFKSVLPKIRVTAERCLAKLLQKFH